MHWESYTVEQVLYTVSSVMVAESSTVPGRRRRKIYDDDVILRARAPDLFWKDTVRTHVTKHHKEETRRSMTTAYILRRNSFVNFVVIFRKRTFQKKEMPSFIAAAITYCCSDNNFIVDGLMMMLCRRVRVLYLLLAREKEERIASSLSVSGEGWSTSLLRFWRVGDVASIDTLKAVWFGIYWWGADHVY